MRLINTRTLLVELFEDDRNLQYAILSHRWLADEVTLDDIRSGSAPQRSGYEKLRRSCSKALGDGYDYLWMDTCCIDKTSSAELSEAINSMYRWYQHSAVCYAFLHDVTRCDIIESTSGSFHKSVWFTRGWTLQELLAPESVEFYNCDWQRLGTKNSLSQPVSEITGISSLVLSGEAPVGYFSVAQRMSWASKRQTTRVEDVAYSLMGLFDINMPMIYGEGKKAFMRLQEEIMKNHDDSTLFAWDMLDDGYRGPFAQSPSEFASCGKLVVATKEWQSSPPLLSSKGVSVALPMIPWALEVYLVALDCWDSECYQSDPETARIGIWLSLLPRNQQYARIRMNNSDRMILPESWKSRSKVKQGFIVKSLDSSPPPLKRFHGFWIRSLPSSVHGPATDAFANVEPHRYLNRQNRKFEIPIGAKDNTCHLKNKHRDVPSLEISFDDEFQIITTIDVRNVRPVGTEPLNNKWTMVIPRESLDQPYTSSEITFDFKKEVLENCLMWVVDIFKTKKRYQMEHRVYHMNRETLNHCSVCGKASSLQLRQRKFLYLASLILLQASPGLRFRCFDCRFKIAKVDCCPDCVHTHIYMKPSYQDHKFEAKLNVCLQKCPICDLNAASVNTASRQGLLKD